MHSSMRLTAFAFLGCLVAETFADQWAWLKKDKVDAVVKLLNPGTVILEWCELCGDPPIPILGKVRTIDSIRVVPAQDGWHDLYLNQDEQGTEFTAVYILRQGHQFENVPLLLGWPTVGAKRMAAPSHEYHRTVDDEPLPEKTIRENAWRLRVLDLAGTWKANQVVTASTCPSAKKGSKRQAQWNFVLRGGRLEVLVQGSGKDPAYYEADLEKAGSLLVLSTGSEE